jgi:uncharacterized protein
VSLAALLDINVLVALFDPAHVHHEAAHVWFAASRSAGWATCPLTENGVVRVLSNPAYPTTAERPAQVIERLRAFCESGDHAFWPDGVSLRDSRIFRSTLPIAHRQLTDIYLLGLAKKQGGRLATFDRHIPLGALVGGRADDLLVIPA